MSRHALLQNNIITQIVDTSVEKFDVHSDLEWVELTEVDESAGVACKWIKQADTFVNPNVLTTSQKCNNIRKMVKSLLQESDWTELGNCGLSGQEITDYNTYRSALVVIATDPIDEALYDDTSNPAWPIKPVTTNVRE